MQLSPRHYTSVSAGNLVPLLQIARSKLYLVKPCHRTRTIFHQSRHGGRQTTA